MSETAHNWFGRDSAPVDRAVAVAHADDRCRSRLVRGESSDVVVQREGRGSGNADNARDLDAGDGSACGQNCHAKAIENE